eukprot:gnl/MRDRNA2_/MRDRNA2_42678_c0_seq1.p1 gnl/MRDRNA2_/MRDRNA2_42678_c0~~gnl/MRDRNA2_/MRDRNA2_42678_c0_seq1.p1  ORF type:complete len:226 (+),score=46.07 gnl/MRDRNA2_/MRDRNA2_42678_c0_seq1:127-804(+)
MANSEADYGLAYGSDSLDAFNKLKVRHVLVMYRGIGAFILDAGKFDAWFASLEEAQKNKVNAVTGHRILRNGRRIDDEAAFRDVGEERFWTGKNARSVAGLQYDGLCPEALKLPEGMKCGNMLVLLQLEKKSEGTKLSTFFQDKTMDSADRPDSIGMNIPDAQSLLQFMMMDDALNFDGSGSSSLWTNIGNLTEQRSQPSDRLGPYGQQYQFRPSPTLFGFAASN